MAKSKVNEIERMVDFIITAYKAGGKVVLFGNGGSAADAQHIAGELVGKFKLNRQALPAIVLTTNTSILTAVANDYGYETVFSRQVEALVNEKDVVIGISTSGNSPNVIETIKTVKMKGAKTPRNIRIRLSVLYQARVAAVIQKKTLEQWLDEAIIEKVDKEQKQGKEIQK